MFDNTQPTNTNIQYQRLHQRFGCMAARIGANLAFRPSISLALEPPVYDSQLTVKGATVQKLQPPKQFEHKDGVAKRVKPNTVVYLAVEDITRYPDEAQLAHWVCKHPSCQHEKWSSKAELLKSHRPQKDLVKDMEIHVYHAVYEEAAKPARPEKKDDKGRVIEPAQEATEARVLLLSDEE